MMSERLYGRKKEEEYLEKVLHSFLKESGAAIPPGIATAPENGQAYPGSVGYDSSGAPIMKDRCNCHFVLVTGDSGSGKRAFARSVLQKNLRSLPTGSLASDPPFLFVAGRFRPFRHPESVGADSTSVLDIKPFTAIDEVIEEILSSILYANQLMISVHEQLDQFHPDDLEILTSAIPSLKRWLQRVSNPKTSESLVDSAKDSSIPKTPVLKPVLLGSQFVAQQVQVRSPLMIRFLQAVIVCVPLVLLLEDIQYADKASLLLLEDLMGQTERDVLAQESNGLLIVATSEEPKDFSTNDVSGTFLTMMPCKNKQILRDSKATSSFSGWECKACSNCCFHQICLSKLSWEDVFDWVQTASGGMFKRFSKQQQLEITNLAFHHSNGNLFHLRYCLLFLAHDERIFHGEDAIHKMSLPKSVTELYAAILWRQDSAVQNVVRTVAAIVQFEGNVHHTVLDVALESPCIDTIIVAHELGLLEFEPTRAHVSFTRSDFQKVAYDSIPSINRASLHLDIGRRIWRSAIEKQKELCDDENIGMVLLATQQLRHCINRLVDLDERLYMAQLCFESGQKSSISGDSHTAAKLFEFSLLVMGPVLWRPDLYETSLVVHNAAAQAYYSTGDLKKMELTLDLIFDHASCFHDKLSAYIILVYSFGTRLQLYEGFRAACLVLHEIGERVIMNPGVLTIVSHLVRTKLVLYGKSDNFFRNLPIADDDDYLILTQFLNFAMFHAYVADPEASILLCFRLIRLSIKNGISGPSVVAFTSYGFMLCTLGSFDEGYRYGQLAHDLAQKFEVWRPRVKMILYGYIYYWLHPFRSCLEPLHQAQHSAFRYNDLEVYAGSTGWHLLAEISVGSCLNVLATSARSFCRSLDQFGLKNALIFALPILELVCDLSENTEPLIMSGEIKDVATALAFAVKEGHKYTVGHVYSIRTVWQCLVGEYSDALLAARKSVEYRQVSDHNLTFYEALAALAMAEASRGLTRRKHRNRGRMLTKRMKGWARRCPENFLNKQLLLEAELAALNGNTRQVVSLFEQSIDKAKQEGFCHEEGIAYERLGHYQLSRGQVSNATMSYECARAAYENWGATKLVNRMGTLLASLIAA